MSILILICSQFFFPKFHQIHLTMHDICYSSLNSYNFNIYPNRRKRPPEGEDALRERGRQQWSQK